MISRQHKKRERQKTIQQFALAVLFLILVGFLNVTNQNPLTGISHVITAPALKTEDKVMGSVISFLNVLRSKQSLIEENNNLKQQLLETEGSSILNAVLKEENAELRYLLGRDVEDNLILGTVLTKPNVSLYDTLIIDIGAKEGVHVGDKVLALGDFFVGFVSKVFTDSAQVTLFSSPGVKTNILVGEEDLIAVAIGRGAGNFSFELSRDFEISEGDVITLANFSTQAFGEVESIIHTEIDAFQVVLFKSPVNIFTIKKIQVIRSNSEI